MPADLLQHDLTAPKEFRTQSPLFCPELLEVATAFMRKLYHDP